ncbi:MAG: ABC transporter ATP-binding protein [Clostridioides sp.]|jgi:ABC-2 type transport system ATP-binding protein|nr:ABC transporter ATP-binding protein [Clostridioides sp.]
MYTAKAKKGIFGRADIRKKVAVDDISIEIKKGHITGLLGLNGAGKTTTIKMLTTLLAPTSGIIEIDYVDIIKDKLYARNKINLIMGGERGVYWRLTERENLRYFGSLYKINPKELDRRIEETLEVVGLQKAADIVVEKYSKGMKQRLQIARGLINNSEYLFFDEPTLGLDIVIAKELRNHIRKLAD